MRADARASRLSWTDKVFWSGSGVVDGARSAKMISPHGLAQSEAEGEVKREPMGCSNQSRPHSARWL